jgi:cell division transport system permease protein
MENFVANYPDEALFHDLDPEILRDRYSIHVEDLEQQGATLRAIDAVKGIDDITAYEEVADGFIAIRNVATVVCVALIVILFVVSVFITSNTVKLTTFDRREEIAIMRMVGATKGFIRWPFVYEGFLLGLLSAGIAFGLQWLLYDAMLVWLEEMQTLDLFSFVPFEVLLVPMVCIFAAAGLFVGIVGSWTSIRKFLNV